jgi:hypothetical protein
VISNDNEKRSSQQHGFQRVLRDSCSLHPTLYLFHSCSVSEIRSIFGACLAVGTGSHGGAVGLARCIRIWFHLVHEYRHRSRHLPMYIPEVCPPEGSTHVCARSGRKRGSLFLRSHLSGQPTTASCTSNEICLSELVKELMTISYGADIEVR